MILITGAKGQLGFDFQRLFNEKGIDYCATDYDELNITDSVAVKRYIDEHIRATGKHLYAIINCAAYNNVDKAESEKEACYALNAYAPRDLALIAKEAGAQYITYSTDFVFDGKKTVAYTESDEPQPLSVYGHAKREGERLTFEAYSSSYVIRTSWVFGIANKNFNTQVIAWSKTKNELAIVDDQVSVPTYSKDLAYYSWLLLQTKQYGLYHLTNNGIASKYDQAQYVLNAIGWKGVLTHAKTRDFPLPAQRAPYSKLDVTKIETVLGLHIPQWQDALDRYLRDEIL